MIDIFETQGYRGDSKITQGQELGMFNIYGCVYFQYLLQNQ